MAVDGHAGFDPEGRCATVLEQTDQCSWFDAVIEAAGVIARN
jgi:hypothetical protein